ncbi:MAG TPA: response regulator [Acidobacteriaceae bacterium]
MPTGRNLLIVDNQRAIAYSLGLVFEREGYEVKTANATATGLKLAETWQPDIAIAGMILDRLNGVAFARQLVSLHPKCRVILTAAQVSSALIEEARSLGFDFYHYPVHPKILIERVNSLLADAPADLSP